VPAGRWVAAGAAAVAAGLGLWFFMRRKPDGVADPKSSTPEEVEALARAIASEAGGEPRIIQAAVGYAVLNESIRRGTSVWRLVRGTADAWGAQGSGGRGFVSSRLAPTAAHIQLGRAVLSGDEPDPTGGATQFDSPRAQRALLARGTPGYTKTPEDVAAARIADGKVMVLLPGVPEERFRMWKAVA
jgi:hypothetical protein